MAPDEAGNGKAGNFVLAAVSGAVTVFGLTALIYGTFFQDLLEQFNELSAETTALITRDSINIVAIVAANLAHGFLLAFVIRWGRSYSPLRGAGAAAIIAFLTEVYFLFTQYAIFKTMSLPSAILDTVMWTLINSVVGALVAWILARSVGRSRRAAAVRRH